MSGPTKIKLMLPVNAIISVHQHVKVLAGCSVLFF